MVASGRALAAFLASALALACQITPFGAAPTATPATPTPAAASPTPALASPLAFELVQGIATIRIREQLINWTAPDDAILTSDAVTGRFGLHDDGSFDPASSFAVSLRTIKSDDFRRADAARETMNADRFPTVEFRPTRADGVPFPLPAAGTWQFRLLGKLRVNGVERDTTWDARAERSADTLRVTASTKFPFGEFGMDPPRRGPVLSLVDEIRLQIDADARRVGAVACTATPQDVPANYKAGAPVRAKIGAGGYVFSGTVRSAGSCAPIARAAVELWHANASGAYDDDHRATAMSDDAGRFRLDTVFPKAYGGGPSHIHIRVTAPRHQPLVSIFFPRDGTASGEMDLVVTPQ